MNDPSGVSCVQCLGDLDGEREKDFHFQRTPSDAVLQSRAVQKLHRDERMTIVLADFVNRADVGVVESGCSASLTTKSFESLRVLSYILRQEFQGDKATEFGILGLVDHTHPTTAQLLKHAVMRDGLADELERSGH
jgi:hypothetical protein